MALAQHKVDFVDCLLAMAGRGTGAERRQEGGFLHQAAPGFPARQAPGLLRQVLKRHLHRSETAAKARRIDGVIRFIRLRILHWCGLSTGCLRNNGTSGLSSKT